jgi:hypothetical protein
MKTYRLTWFNVAAIFLTAFTTGYCWDLAVSTGNAILWTLIVLNTALFIANLFSEHINTDLCDWWNRRRKDRMPDNRLEELDLWDQEF